MAEWHLLRHHTLKDSVFEGGMNTNHKMGEEQVACVFVCVTQLSSIGMVDRGPGQAASWTDLSSTSASSGPESSQQHSLLLVLVRVPACKHAH